MKTFESQLLELLREYEKTKVYSDTITLCDFTDWLSKRVEKEEECKHKFDPDKFISYNGYGHSVCQDCKQVFKVRSSDYLKTSL